MKAFGEIVLLPNGELNRDLLAQIIFSDKEARKKLNNITHPIILFKVFLEILYYWTHFYEKVIIDMPLLHEVRASKICHYSIFVWCDENSQIKRLMKRDEIPFALSKDKIMSQMPMSKKRMLSDILLDNSGSIENLKKQVNHQF